MSFKNAVSIRHDVVRDGNRVAPIALDQTHPTR